MKHFAPLLLLPLVACRVLADDVPADAEWTPLPATAWHWSGHRKMEGLPKMWTVEADGSLHHAPGNGSWAHGDLISDDGTYENFVLELEWKVGKAANSGIFYRTRDGRGNPSAPGFEYQVLDDAGFQGGKAGPLHRAGALYAIVPANDQKELKPLGEWNATRIVAQGRHVEHWLNGKCIVKVDLDSPEFKATFAKSEWRGNPAKGAAPNGHLGLQDHGGEVWYRNIRVKKVPAKVAE